MPILRRTAPFLLAGLLLAGPVTPRGEWLAGRFDAMDVAHHWLPGRHVDWRTGEADPGRPGKTHCSAFAAAACKRLGIYLLHPPEHPAHHLATAQAQWLASAGPAQGWAPVASPSQAQDLANQGQLVVAVYPSPDPARSGHVALVRPDDKPEPLLEAEGPQVIQAGAENAASISLKQGFRHHRGAWVSGPEHQVQFYAHPIP